MIEKNTFREIREDGAVIVEGMTVEDVLKLGKPSPVRYVQWSSGGHMHRFGERNQVVLADVFLDRSGLALLPRPDSGERMKLIVLNADGSTRFELGPSFEFHGRKYQGTFGHLDQGFESGIAGEFSVTFLNDLDQEYYEITFDARTAETKASKLRQRG